VISWFQAFAFTFNLYRYTTAGLAVKAKALLDGESEFPLAPFVYVLCASVCYGKGGAGGGIGFFSPAVVKPF
jgi:hypothetical protein